MKPLRFYSLCAGALVLEYLLLRFPLFSLHGMKDWPAVLLVFGLISMAISLLLRGRQLPPFTAIGYGVGFLAGYIFQSHGTDPGGGITSNLFVIWTVVMVCAVVSALMTDLLSRRKTK